MTRANKTFDTVPTWLRRSAGGARNPAAVPGEPFGRDATWSRGARSDSLISAVYPGILNGARPGERSAATA